MKLGFMDWDWKDLTTWDGAELELQGNAQKKSGVLVDLTRCETADSGFFSVADKLKDPSDSKGCSSPSSRLVVEGGEKPGKRTRALGGSQSMSCLVDGCNSDLSNCKEYHRKHRVCEQHSKTPVVIVGGKQQRFCQQCSRFHSLGEFDEVKRSCRKRLDGHNKRRRKPQPASIFMAAEKFLSNYRGPRILQFNNPQIYAAPTFSNMWPVIAKGQAQPAKHSKLNYGNQAASGNSFRQPLSSIDASTESGKSNFKLLTSGITRSVDSGCALYLLSSLQTQTSGLSFVQSHGSNLSQPFCTEPNFDALNKDSSWSNGAKDKPAGSVLVLEPNAANNHQNGLLHVESDGLMDYVCTRDMPLSFFSLEYDSSLECG